MNLNEIECTKNIMNCLKFHTCFYSSVQLQVQLAVSLVSLQ